MINCREFYLDDLMAVTAIPVEDFDASTEAWQLTPTIDADYFTPTISNAVVIGMQPAVTGGALIPVRRGTGKVKDDESDSVYGRLHTVSVSCEVDDRERSIWDLLLALERGTYHLLLTFREGQQAFVSGSEDTYQCTVERDGSKTTVSFKVQCLMGLQLIV